jgi:hypothetical protein
MLRTRVVVFMRGGKWKIGHGEVFLSALAGGVAIDEGLEPMNLLTDKSRIAWLAWKMQSPRIKARAGLRREI